MAKNVKKRGKGVHKEKQSPSSDKKTSSESGPHNLPSPNGEAGKRKDREPCPHIGRGVTLDKLNEKLGSSTSSKCEDCRGTSGDRKAKKGKGKTGKKGGNNSNSELKSIWVCLSCGHFSCGGIGLPTTPQSHSFRHAKQNHHPLVVHYENHQLIWCFLCDKLIHAAKFDDGVNKDVLNEAVKILKDGPSEKSSVDMEDSRFGRDTNNIKGDSSNTSADGKSACIVRGLVNLGNTCFFNSVVQNLLALSKVRDHFLKLDESFGPISSSLRKLFLETSNGPGLRGAIDPKSLLSSLCIKAPQFKGYQQHDSHEFLRCLLESLSNEELGSKKVIKSSQGSLIDSSFVDAIFGGKLSSTVSCLKCGHASTIYEPFLDLSLPVPIKKGPSKRASLVTQGKKQKLPPRRSGRNLSKANRPVCALQGEKSSDKPTVGEYDPETQPSIQPGEQPLLTFGDSASSSSIFSENIVLDMGLTTGDLSAIKDSNNNQAANTVGNPSFDDFSWLDYIAPNEAPGVKDPSDPLLIIGSLTVSDHPETYGVTPEISNEVDGGKMSTYEFALNGSVPPTLNDGVLPPPICHVSESSRGDSASLTSMHQSQANLLPGGNFVTENGFCSFEEKEDLIIESNSGDSFTERNSQFDASARHRTESPGEVHSASVRAFENSPEIQDSASIKDLTSSVEVIRTENEVLSEVISDNQDVLDFSGFADLFNEPEVSLESEPPTHSLSDASNITRTGTTGDSSESEPNEVDNDEDPVSVESCIACFMKPELLSKDEHAWQCDNCSKVLQEKIDRSRKNMQMGTSDLPNDSCYENPCSLQVFHQDASKQITVTDIHHQDVVDSSDVSTLSLDVDVCETRNPLIGNCLEPDSKLPNLHRAAQICIPIHEDCGSDEDALSSSRIQPSKCESGVCNEEVLNVENLKVKRDATKTILINKAPSVLTIHLKRFCQDVQGRLSKLNGHVSFREIINLRPYMDPRCEWDMVKYRLVGVVEHSGTMRFGHYIAYVRATKGNGDCVWYYASDAHIRETSFEEVLRCEAYILFYEAI